MEDSSARVDVKEVDFPVFLGWALNTFGSGIQVTVWSILLREVLDVLC